MSAFSFSASDGSSSASAAPLTFSAALRRTLQDLAPDGGWIESSSLSLFLARREWGYTDFEESCRAGGAELSKNQEGEWMIRLPAAAEPRKATVAVAPPPRPSALAPPPTIPPKHGLADTNIALFSEAMNRALDSLAPDGSWVLLPRLAQILTRREWGYANLPEACSRAGAEIRRTDKVQFVRRAASRLERALPPPAQTVAVAPTAVAPVRQQPPAPAAPPAPRADSPLLHHTKLSVALRRKLRDLSPSGDWIPLKPLGACFPRRDWGYSNFVGACRDAGVQVKSTDNDQWMVRPPPGPAESASAPVPVSHSAATAPTKSSELFETDLRRFLQIHSPNNDWIPLSTVAKTLSGYDRGNNSFIDACRGAGLQLKSVNNDQWAVRLPPVTEPLARAPPHAAPVPPPAPMTAKPAPPRVLTTAAAPVFAEVLRSTLLDIAPDGGWVKMPRLALIVTRRDWGYASLPEACRNAGAEVKLVENNQWEVRMPKRKSALSPFSAPGPAMATSSVNSGALRQEILTAVPSPAPPLAMSTAANAQPRSSEEFARAVFGLIKKFSPNNDWIPMSSIGNGFSRREWGYTSFVDACISIGIEVKSVENSQYDIRLPYKKGTLAAATPSPSDLFPPGVLFPPNPVSFPVELKRAINEMGGGWVQMSVLGAQFPRKVWGFTSFVDACREAGAEVKSLVNDQWLVRIAKEKTEVDDQHDDFSTPFATVNDILG